MVRTRSTTGKDANVCILSAFNNCLREEECMDLFRNFGLRN